jgi:1-acyl-sn-glycerol-3-phosphate acyltransferase
VSDDFETARHIRLMHGINRSFSRIYHHIDVSGLQAIPRTGPAIIMSNHISGLDPLLIQSVLHRPVIWMMAKEYYDIGPLRKLFETLQAIPVSRDGRDSTALRAALRTLDKGRLLGVFPEGRISTTPRLLPFQTGLAMIALRAKASIIPMHISGSTRGRSMALAFAVPQQVRLRFGPPIDLSAKFNRSSDLAAPTALLHSALDELRIAQGIK